MCLRITCSRILHTVEVKEIGVNLDTSVLFPNLCSEMILASFHSFGSLPTVYDLLKRTHKYFNTHSEYRLRKIFVTLSFPVDFFVSMANKRFNTPASVTVRSPIEP